MANGPMTEAEAAQVQWAYIWHRLPDEMREGLAKLEAEHPGEVLSAVSGGVVKSVPEGRELTDWMAELAAAGGFGETDDTARRFDVETYWADPIRPPVDTEYRVGFQVSCNQSPIGDYEVQVSVGKADGTIVQLVSGTYTDVAQGELPLPGMDPGQYVVTGSVNNGGVDLGSAPNEHGYRTAFSFALQVGAYSEGDGHTMELTAQLGHLANQLLATSEPRDFVDLVDAICTDLMSVEALAPKAGTLTGARMSAFDGVRNERSLDRAAVADASSALQALATQLPTLLYRPDDEASKGVVFAHVDEFATRVAEAFPEE